ncbi:Wntless-like transmembrane domain-containing protein [Entamoeba marina]
MVVHMLIDDMKKKSLILLGLFTTFFIIFTIFSSIHYHSTITNSVVSPVHLNLTELVNNTFYVLGTSFETELFDQWLVIYLTLKPKSLFQEQTEFSFQGTAQLNVYPLDGDPYEYTQTREFTTICYSMVCDEIILITDIAIDVADYFYMIKVYEDKSIENFDVTLRVSVSNHVESLISLCLLVGLLVFDGLCVIIFIVVLIIKKRYTPYLLFNLILILLIFICTNPTYLTKFWFNSVVVVSLDTFLLELYMCIFFVYVFFHVDYFRHLAIQEPYPIFQWCGRIFLITAYFILSNVEFIYTIFSNLTPLMPESTNVLSDAVAIKELLQFLLLMWVLMYELFSFSFVTNPVNRKRLSYLMILSFITSFVNIVQLFFQNENSSVTPFPSILVKIINNWFMFMVFLGFYPVKKHDNSFLMETTTYDYVEFDLSDDVTF